MRCLVTGGSGFIGSHLIDGLEKQGHIVFNYDLREAQDLKDFDKFERFCRNVQPDVIFHLANIPVCMFSVDNPHMIIDNNSRADHNVFECARLFDADVVFTSSSSIYGKQEVPWKESMEPEPMTPYAQVKANSERLLRVYNDVYNVTGLVCRLTSVYGSRDKRHQPPHVVRHFYEKTKKEEKIIVYGEERTRDFTHIDDIVNGILKAYNYVREEDVGYDIFNIGCGKEYNLKEFAEFLSELYGGKSEVEVKPLEELTEYTPMRWYCDISKLKEKTGFEPETDLYDFFEKVKQKQEEDSMLIGGLYTSNILEINDSDISTKVEVG